MSSQLSSRQPSACQSHWALVHHHLPLSVELARSASQVGLVRIIMLPHSHSQTFLNVMAEWNRPGGRRVPNNSELRRGQRLERRFLDTFQTEALRHLFLSQSLYHRMFLLWQLTQIGIVTWCWSVRLSLSVPLCLPWSLPTPHCCHMPFTWVVTFSASTICFVRAPCPLPCCFLFFFNWPVWLSIFSKSHTKTSQ